MICKYEKEGMSGLDCPCIKCQKIRDLLFQGELAGDLFISGTEEDKEKIRR